MKKTLINPESNPYCHWLMHDGNPPLSASFAQAEEAFSFLKHEVNSKLHYKRIAALHLDSFLSIIQVQQWLAALSAFLGSQVCVREDFDAEKTFELKQHIKAHNRRIDYFFHKPAVRKIMRAIRKDPAHKSWKNLIDICLPSVKSQRNLQKVDLVSSQMQKQEYLYDEKATVQKDGQNGKYLHTLNPIPYYKKNHLTLASKTATSMGLKGYVFNMGEEETDSLEFCALGDLRQAYCYNQYTHPLTSEEIDERVALRNSLGQLKKNKNYAAYQLNGSLLSNPSVLSSILRSNLNKIRNKSAQYVRSSSRYSKEQYGTTVAGDDLAAYWNTQAFLTDYEVASFEASEALFPVHETIQKIVVDLMAEAGWEMVAPIATLGQGQYIVYHFYLEKKGKKAHIIYNPYRPKSGGADYSAATAASVMTHWHGKQKRACLVWIDQDMDGINMDVKNIKHLCHELGHALHYMEMEGSSPYETAMVCEDLYEIPSHMMELYMQDPKVMASWVSEHAPEETKQAEYWMNNNDAGTGKILSLQRSLLHALNDLEIYTTKGTAEDVCRANYNEQGLTFHADYSEWKNCFINEDGMACTYYQQLFPRGMALSLIPVSKKNTTEAKMVTELTLSLIHNVLNKGDSSEPDKVKRAWKKWAGTSFSSALRHALEMIGKEAIASANRNITYRKNELEA